jgi:hypothetical protein
VYADRGQESGLCCSQNSKGRQGAECSRSNACNLVVCQVPAQGHAYFILVSTGSLRKLITEIACHTKQEEYRYVCMYVKHLFRKIIEDIDDVQVS